MCYFFSFHLCVQKKNKTAFACLYPFLSSHMKEIGLTSYESAYLNAITPICGLIATPVSGVVAHVYNKYQTLLIITLIASAISHTSLLFIPRVIRHPRHPSIIFDCSNSQLRIEHCPDWPSGSCATKPKAPSIGNFTNFSLTKCTYVCPATVALNSSWYPLSVCFTSASEVSYCLLHDPQITDKGSPGWAMDKGGNIPFGDSMESIQFDSRFDRWPVVSLKNDKECVYQSVAPLILAHKSYEMVQCRPFVHSCQIHCKVNLLHRTSRDSSTSAPKQPTLCYDITGDPMVTFYSYLVVRSAADLFSFVAYNLLDALLVTLTNNFDSLYGGTRNVLSIILPLSYLPFISGLLIDYYSHQAGRADYAPPFILFDGLILITTVLVVAAPAAPLVSLSSEKKKYLTSNNVDIVAASTSLDSWEVSSSTSIRNSSSRRKLAATSTTSLRSTPSLRILNQKKKIPRLNWYILIIALVPLILISGIIYTIITINMYPFLIDTGTNKTWIGGTFSTVFIAFIPLSLLGKKLVSGLGRLHLILIGFTFHALHLTGLSFLPPASRTLLIPLSLIQSFTLPIMWIGITSYSHYLIKTTLRPELMTRTVVDPSTSNHLKMQYFINFLHFGCGKVIGSLLLLLWIQNWHDEALNNPIGGIKKWYWLNIQEIGFPEVDADGYRILLRLLALICACISLPILFFAHIFGEIVRFCVATGNIIKVTLFKTQNCLVKTFTLLCCCSCSCKLAKCRLCRVKRRRKRRTGGRRKINSTGSSCDTDASSDEDDVTDQDEDTDKEDADEEETVSVDERRIHSNVIRGDKVLNNVRDVSSLSKQQQRRKVENVIELKASSQKNELQMNRNNLRGKKDAPNGVANTAATRQSEMMGKQSHQVKYSSHLERISREQEADPAATARRDDEDEVEEETRKRGEKEAAKYSHRSGEGEEKKLLKKKKKTSTGSQVQVEVKKVHHSEQDHPVDVLYSRLVNHSPPTVTTDAAVTSGGGHLSHLPSSSSSPYGSLSGHGVGMNGHKSAQAAAAAVAAAATAGDGRVERGNFVSPSPRAANTSPSGISFYPVHSNTYNNVNDQCAMYVEVAPKINGGTSLLEPIYEHPGSLHHCHHNSLQPHVHTQPPLHHHHHHHHPHTVTATTYHHPRNNHQHHVHYVPSESIVDTHQYAQPVKRVNH